MSRINKVTTSAVPSKTQRRGKFGRWIAYAVSLLLASAIAIFLYLVIVVPPSQSSLLKYEGAYSLPSHGALNVLDYLSVSSNNLFVAGESSGSFFQIFLPAHGTRVRELQGAPHSHGFAVVPELQLGFASRSGVESQVDVVDIRDMTLLSTIPVAEDADSILYDDLAKLIYVANGDAKLATIIDPSSRSVLGSVSLPGSPEGAVVDRSSGLLYQNLEDRNSIAAVDLSSRSVAGEWPLSGCDAPSGIAIDPVARRVFSGCKGNARLVIFGLDSHRVLASVGIVEKPDAIAYDAALHRIYAAGTGGRLSVVLQDGGDQYRLGANIRTHYGAHTVAIDELTHRVYVGYASLLVSPRVVVFSATP
jgi:DNA-binding beta-propeller fold protein YncE